MNLETVVNELTNEYERLDNVLQIVSDEKIKSFLDDNYPKEDIYNILAETVNDLKISIDSLRPMIPNDSYIKALSLCDTISSDPSDLDSISDLVVLLESNDFGVPPKHISDLLFYKTHKTEVLSNVSTIKSYLKHYKA